MRECRHFAERHGYDVVPALVFEEAGVSGASRHNRPRLLELVARIDEWDVLLAFDFSRLARNQRTSGGFGTASGSTGAKPSRQAPGSSSGTLARA